MKLTLFSLLTTFSLSSSLLVAQVSDNFDDGDFTTNPTWSGSTSDFEVLAGQLKNINAKISKEIDKQNDNRGNIRDLKATTAETNVNKTFKLRINK